MKTLFIPAKINSEVNENKIKALKLPKNIAIAYSIQYKDIATKIKEILSGKYKITEMIQTLGCSKPKLSKDTQAILLIGSGRFHAISLALESGLPIYILESNELTRISKEETDSLKKKKLASYMNFLNSEKVGILVSIKPGQEKLKKALALKSKLKNKKCYLFLSNETDIGQFENFNDINSWVNTACPRLDFDSSVINIDDLEKKE
jgi:diphthamide biosynthesis enzyme Dph1/Dph2-like protein